MKKNEIDENFKVTVNEDLSYEQFLLFINSTMAGHVKFLTERIQNHSVLEKKELTLMKKIISGYFDLTSEFSKKDLTQTLKLMTGLQLEDSPVYGRLIHNFLRIMINLHCRSGNESDECHELFLNDICEIKSIIEEPNPENLFQLITFPPDFITLLTQIACTNLCLTFYTKVNGINKDQDPTIETTRFEIIKIISTIIEKKCYFTKIGNFRGETLYNNKILINNEMKIFQTSATKKLELIFTILHEINHLKRIIFCDLGDYLSKTPPDFYKKFHEVVKSLDQTEKKTLEAEPEIGDLFERFILGSVFKYPAFLFQNVFYCNQLMNPENWDTIFFSIIETNFKEKSEKSPGLCERLKNNRKSGKLLSCRTCLNLNSKEIDDILRRPFKINP